MANEIRRIKLDAISVHFRSLHVTFGQSKRSSSELTLKALREEFKRENVHI